MHGKPGDVEYLLLTDFARQPVCFLYRAIIDVENGWPDHAVPRIDGNESLAVRTDGQNFDRISIHLRSDPSRHCNESLPESLGRDFGRGRMRRFRSIGRGFVREY